MRWDCTVISSSLPKQDSNASTIPSDSVTLRWAHFSVPQFSYLQEAENHMAHLLRWLWGCRKWNASSSQQRAWNAGSTVAVDLCHFPVWQPPKDGRAGLTWRQRGATCLSRPVFVSESTLEGGVTARGAGSRLPPPAHSEDCVPV